jgi:hypothetical protein
VRILLGTVTSFRYAPDHAQFRRHGLRRREMKQVWRACRVQQVMLQRFLRLPRQALIEFRAHAAVVLVLTAQRDAAAQQRRGKTKSAAVVSAVTPYRRKTCAEFSRALDVSHERGRLIGMFTPSLIKDRKASVSTACFLRVDSVPIAVRQRTEALVSNHDANQVYPARCRSRSAQRSGSCEPHTGGGGSEHAACPPCTKEAFQMAELRINEIIPEVQWFGDNELGWRLNAKQRGSRPVVRSGRREILTRFLLSKPVLS